MGYKNPNNIMSQLGEFRMSISTEMAEKIIDDVKDRWVSLGRDSSTLYLYENHVKGSA